MNDDPLTKFSFEGTLYQGRLSILVGLLRIRESWNGLSRVRDWIRVLHNTNVIAVVGRE